MEARTFTMIVADMVQLHDKKNKDYGNAFGKSFAKFGLMATDIRLTDKFSRFESLMDIPALVSGESIKDTLIDMAAYCIMTVEALEKQEAELEAAKEAALRDSERQQAAPREAALRDFERQQAAPKEAQA